MTWSCIFQPLGFGIAAFSRSCKFQPCDLVRYFRGPAFDRCCIFSRPSLLQRFKDKNAPTTTISLAYYSLVMHARATGTSCKSTRHGK